MKQSKDLMKVAGILPKLRLGKKKSKGGTEPTGPHRVKMIADKVIQDIDPQTGKEVDFVRYLVEENGERKTYQTKKLDKKGELSYLVRNLSEIEEGQEVILEMKKQGIKNYIDVSLAVGSESIEMEDDEEVPEDINIDDIPE